MRVAPATVSLWEDASTTMKPNFALTGDQALAKVLPTTESVNQQILTAFGAGIAAGFPQITSNNSAGTTNSQQNGSSTAGGVTTTTASTSAGTTSSTTTQAQNGTPPTIPTGTPAGGALPAAAGATATLGLDPVLQYKAANHLLQEVQLLNQEIDDAANRKCFVPYVVGLKISIINYRPHLAYSLHEHVGFFFRSRISDREIGSSGEAAFVGDDFVPPPAAADLAVGCRVNDLEPEAIPLLVTDDIQVAIKARAAEAAEQLAAALSFMVHGVGVGANLNAVKQSLESIQNHDLTSSMTVGRDTSSSIYVEVSPNNTASGDPSLVNQTYDVPVLLLIPRSYFGGVRDVSPVQISVTTYQQLRDAASGAVLPGRPAAVLVREASDILEPYLLTQNDRRAWDRLSDDERLAAIRPLYADSLSGDMGGLVRDLKAFTSFGPFGCDNLGDGESRYGPCVDYRQASNLWTALGVLGNDSNASNAILQLPLPTPITVQAQQVVLADDGENSVQAVLGGVGGRSITKLAAQLRLTPYDATSGVGAEVDVPAQKLTLDPTAHTLTLSFPSLKKLGVGCLSPTEAEPLPKAPTPTPPARKGAKGAKGTPPPAPAADTPKCPARAVGAGNAARPNRIVLSLVGCDPKSQLCPDLTATDEAADPTLAQRMAERVKAEALFDQAQADVKSNAGVSASMAAALAELKAARSKVQAARSAEYLPAAEASLDQAVGALAQASQSQSALLNQKVTAANVIGQLNLAPDKVSLIGVTLVTTPNSTDPAKLKVSAASASVCLQDGGLGTLQFQVTGTPTADSGAFTIDGATVASTLDSNTNMPMTYGKTGYTFTKDGRFTIGLMNLTENATVSLSVQAYTGTKSDGNAAKSTYSVSPHCSPLRLVQH